MTCKSVPEMTYNVSSVTLNPTIPNHLCFYVSCFNFSQFMSCLAMPKHQLAVGGVSVSVSKLMN